MAFIVRRQGAHEKLYYVVYKGPDGKNHWKAAGRRRRDADELLRRIRSEIAAGTLGKQKTITFAVFSEKWLEDYAEVKCRERTIVDYKQVIKNHLVPFFGKYLLENITPAQVQDYVSLKSRSGLSPRTVNKTITLLKTMFKHAARWEYIKENPARFAEKPPDPKKERGFLTPDEIKRFLDASSPEYFAFFATAVLTGARQGELLALRRADVDLERRTINITRSYHPQFGFNDPKTPKSKRSIAISKELAKILEEHLRVNEGKPEDLLFSNRAGNPINPQNMMTREFHPAIDRAGLKHIRFHDLRHTYGAIMVLASGNLKFMQKQFGHASITTTMDIYGHLLPEVSDGFGDKLDSLVFSNDK